MAQNLPASVDVLIEVPRGSFVKRELHGEARVNFVSPLPSPFNYGCVPELAGADGDPVDVVVMGPRLPLGVRVRRPVVGLVRFIDDGASDDKLVASLQPLRPWERRALRLFFRAYALGKSMLGRRDTRFLGLEEG